MRKLIAITQVTLDGVMQSPGGPEEDPRNGFTHGGWVMPFWDDALNQAIGETIAGEFDMLLGRRTYEIFAAVGARRRKAAVREQRSSARPHSGRDAKHAQGRPHQHLPTAPPVRSKPGRSDWKCHQKRNCTNQTTPPNKGCGPGFSVRSLPAQGSIQGSFPAKFPTHNPTHNLICLVRLTRCLAVPACLLSRCNTYCHGRGRGFESRRPRHFKSKTYRKPSDSAWARKGTK